MINTSHTVTCEALGDKAGESPKRIQREGHFSAANSTCPRCQGAFECKAGDILQCSCYGLSMPAELKTQIGQLYAGCLCHNCLVDLSNQSLVKKTGD